MSDVVISEVRTTVHEAEALAMSGTRLQSIDIMRGIVIVLMALDHVRDYFHASAFLFNPLDVHKTTAALYATRWITNFCAPTFVFLAGVSAFLYGVKVNDRRALSRFLLTRGFWLVVLELTVINFAWNFSLPEVGLQVIWALGASMVVLSALVWLPQRAVLAIGIVLVAGHNALDGVAPAAFGAWAPLWVLLHAGGAVQLQDVAVAWVVYPLLPWIGVMAMGYGLGFVFQQTPAARRKTFTLLGFAMIAGFVLLRGLDLYGDPRAWSVHPALPATIGDFLNAKKYPPSLLYVLMTIGPMFVLLPRLERLQGFAAGLLLQFGRVPLFFYVLHLYLAHTLMLAIATAMGHPAAIAVGVMSGSTMLVERGWGFSLPVVYAVWLLVLALLYPACRWFAEVKRRRRDWWLSYL
jgi:uncharacterized membrane protein